MKRTRFRFKTKNPRQQCDCSYVDGACMFCHKPKHEERLKPKFSAPPTTEESRHMNAVASLGCLICRMPANIHHVKHAGQRKRDHMKVLPLCVVHHQTGGLGVAGCGSR